MAHSCPDCGQTCYCGGDIDDIDFGDDSPEAIACSHCDCRVCKKPRDMCDCDPPDPIEDEDL